jgi:hypothetical protein
MAKVKIQGNASGTGVFTITPPATSTDRTLTLPDSAGTILDSTSTLDATKLSGNLPAISGASLTNLPGGGKVLQVVSVTTGSEKVTSSSSFVDTNVTATITPTSATSKVLVLLSVNGCYKNNSDTRLRLKLLRGATAIVSSIDDAVAVTEGTNTVGVGGVSLSHLDSPATTSATTYKVQIASGAGTLNVRINVNYGAASNSSITLMEIGA